MDQPPELPPTSVWVLLWLGAWACFTAWFAAVRKWRQGKPLVAFQRRRQVPWNGFDLLLVFAFFILSSAAMFFAVELLLGPNADLPEVGASADKSHEISQLLRGGDVWTILVCVFAAVLIAPLSEEFLFRVLLQGWLERIDRRLGPLMPNLRRIFPWSVGPVLLSSFIFAAVHFRVASQPVGREYLSYIMMGNSLVGIATVVFAVLLLRYKAGATATDMGFDAKKLPGDVGLGLATAAGVIFPIFMLQFVLNSVLPSWLAADPLPIFCFALVLGTLYCRTHRVAASVVLHMSLNATSLAMFWLWMPAAA